jgi:peptidoglycan/xylan/chitin deacetylase (PgdA/CDA1 family)
MRSRALGTALAGILVVTLSPAVLAQGQAEEVGFAWPIQEWQARTDELTTPRSKALPSAKVVRKGPRSSGAVALTFDDGYNVAACASIARTLRRHGAVGTFFINGWHLKAEPNRWRRILEGMEVANHTRSHRDLTKEPHSVVIKQIMQNETLHEEILGRPMLKVLRPPYGAYGDRVGRIARQLGYEHVVMWSVDTGDWRPDIRTRAIVRRATGAPAGSIILMHCTRDATAKALPRIVRHYQRRGIEVVGLSQVLKGARGVGGKGVGEPYGG